MEKSKPEVQLTGMDGNAFVLLGKMRCVLKKAGYSQEEITQFTDEATSGDYNNLLATCCKWADVR